MTSKRLLTRAFVVLSLSIVMSWSQQGHAQESSPESQPVQATPTPESSALDNLQNALNEQNTTQPEVAADPNKPRRHQFTNQPVGTVLRTLAEEAQINYIEPNINPEERISLILPAMTPIQAFYAVAEARGFKVVTKRDSNIITLSRSDINTPSYYVMRAYRLRYQAAEDLKQTVAGFLGIQVKPVSTVNPAYPPPVNGQPGSAAYAGAPEVNAGAAGGIQTLYSAGTE
ncbi:MAG: hypothetical protein JO077_11195, partial [Verrucomicrobia bacterium]|nr:hypothetical protein [Verrucomicrobiota bacterium]